ncbi:penicillin acylase family protein [Aureispira sp. CCB-QB1]|uniref:penicillin acylase family protein n=1 Tax=Aureispira sp. CCB-QB1 TaxID=1313421 RepID=UPI0009DF665C|nr:penicillin acylase family protein [Aureispira sp. CCB-QB1]
MTFLTKMLKPVLKWFVHKQAKNNLPNLNEIIHAPDLKGKVEIIRDQWSVPHIYAESKEDAFFAQGYVHAQERLWQMELTRRIVSGRLSEVIGKDALEVDRIARIMGFKHLGQTDEQEASSNVLFPYLESYVKGVNYFIATCKYPPVEFKLLKVSMENWTVADCFGMARLLAMQMSQGWLHELERMGMAELFGLEKAQEIFPEYLATNPVCLNYGIETNERKADGTLEAFKGPYLRPLGGSNNWVVAADKMDTGAAALCNDPHLLINTPNIWYENHLVAPDYEVTGVSIPGVPLVLIGHNANMAWGATLTYADIQDTYIEKFVNPDGLQYHFGDRILKASVRVEKIYIKGEKAPHEEKVIQTHHGPAILNLDGTHKVTLCSRALQQNEMIFGFYELNVAENWNDFVAACEKLTVPSLNLVYADIKNNIGYYMTGEVPIRARSKGLLPNKGYDALHEWTGRVPFEAMPHVLNPTQGYYYTCNNKLVGDDYPYDLGNIWMNGYRAKRLQTLLDSKDKFGFDDFASWQLDFVSLPGASFIQLVRRLIQEKQYENLSGYLKKTVDLFLNWDCELTADSVGGAIYQVLKQELIDLIFDKNKSIRGVVPRKELPIFAVSEFFGHDVTAILRLFDNPNSVWWERSPEEILLEALKNTTEYLTNKLGSNTANWKWGRLHPMVAKHALGVKPILGEIFDTGNLPIGGDTDTLCQMAFVPGEHYGGKSLIGASYRQMIDMGDFANSKCIAPVGQSGNVQSPHYADQMERWVNGDYKTMLWTREQVEQHQRYRAELNPL